jgi:signal transduction histidine kinase
MAPPPEALAAGWPAAIGLALALGVTRTRTRRRRASLEVAIHELRRPLQALSLSAARCSRAGATSCPGAGGRHLSGALSALSDLERAISDGPPALRLQPTALRALVEAALERCLEPEQAPKLFWAAGDARVLADPVRLGRAIDNLLENALEHGRPPVRISASICEGGVRLVISNAVPPSSGGVVTAAGRGRGRGLRIVSAMVSAHGGRFLFNCGERSANAMLELPLAPLPFPAAARLPGEPVSLPRAGAG